MKIAHSILSDFLTQGQTQGTLPMLPLADYREAFAQLGFPHYEYEASGWDSDFVLEIENDLDTRYALTGSLFYGNFQISKVEPGDGYFTTLQRAMK